MKINKPFLIASFLLTLSIFTINIYTVAQQNDYSKEKAWQIVKSKILGNNLNNINVFVAKNTTPANSIIKTIYKDNISPNFESWFFFVDDAPFSSWTHPCRYIFINKSDWKITIQERSNPPHLDLMESLVEMKSKSKGQLFDFSKYKTRNRSLNTTNNDYAVIISGGADAFNNKVRYWNHCSALYAALINVYGYTDDHIYVLMSDGTNPANDRHLNDGSYDSSPLDLDGDGDNDIEYSATKANISNVFNTLRNKLTSSDNLFIYSTDHGGQESGNDVYINLR